MHSQIESNGRRTSRGKRKLKFNRLASTSRSRLVRHVAAGEGKRPAGVGRVVLGLHEQGSILPPTRVPETVTAIQQPVDVAVREREQRDRNLQGFVTSRGKAKVSDHAEPEEEVKRQGQEVGAGSRMAGRVGIPFRLQERRINHERECNL